jgi:hypothetical protein
VLVKWVDSFCSDQVVVNGHPSALWPLEQAGLPQRTAIAPVLFLFFNADLVEQTINRNGRSMAFLDDYMAWIVGECPEANKSVIQNVRVCQALKWSQAHGAAFGL